MRPPRFEENDAVFVEPIPRLVPEKPEGFALRVVRVLGRAQPGPTAAAQAAHPRPPAAPTQPRRWSVRSARWLGGHRA